MMTSFVGFFLNWPAYFVIAVGLFVRTLYASKNNPN